jgi:hypothetical protein
VALDHPELITPLDGDSLLAVELDQSDLFD